MYVVLTNGVYSSLEKKYIVNQESHLMIQIKWTQRSLSPNIYIIAHIVETFIGMPIERGE